VYVHGVKQTMLLARILEYLYMYQVNQTSFRWLVAWITLLLIGVPLAAQAQEKPGMLREVGASLSLARTTNGGSSVEASMAERIPVLHVAVGGFVRLELARWNGLGFGVQPELGYVPRGADIELGVSQGNIRSRYLELPILGRIESPPLGPVTLYAVAGPALSYLLSAESKSGTGVVSDTRDVTSKLDFGLAAGAGASVAVTPRWVLGFEGRYTHGFVTLDNTGEFDVENRAIYFSLGVSARFGPDEAAAPGE
jgi:opacity protein-like surface antigen